MSEPGASRMPLFPYRDHSVLVVEDDSGLCKMIQKRLQVEGFRTDSVLSGTEAIARVVRDPSVMMLVDYLLPDMTGKQVIEALNQRQCEVPFIVMTGYGDEKTAVEMMKLGARDYLVKDEELLELLPSVVGRVMEQLRTETKLARAEAALQESQEKYRSFLNNFQGIAYQIKVRNVNTFEVSLLQGTVDKITGYSSEDFVMGKVKWVELIHPDDLPLILEENEKLLSSPGYVADNEYRIRHREGGIRWVRDIGQSICDDSGKVTALYGAVHDIADRKQAEEELRMSNLRLQETLAELKTTQERLVQQERLRALGQLASGIAHDFNNALMPILGYTELLLMVPEKLDDKEKVKDYLELMNTAATDAKNIVGHLRRFYRARDKDEVFAFVDLSKVVEQAIQLTLPVWRIQAQANNTTISIETDLQKDLVINGKEAELREVLTNLILNAVDAISESGTITLRTRADGADVVLEVSDTGIGIPDDVKQRCFEPFFSTKGERGTGLGLAMVHGIIRRHEGNIRVESEVGKGTTFIIRLPRAEEYARGASGEAGIRSAPLHVLFVDDDPMARDIVVEYLAADAHTYEVATNGRDGVEKAREGNFDLIITDRAMPDMSGLQLSIFVKQLAPDMPIIMLTGFGDMMQDLENIPPEIDSVVSKPVTLRKFREALAKAGVHKK